MVEMTHRERVFAAMRHHEPDRIPFDLGSTLVTGITKGAYTRLAQALGEDTGEIELCDTIQQLPVICGNIIERLDVDIRGVIPHFGRKNPKLTITGNISSFTDEWSVKWERPKDGLYFSICGNPLSGSVSRRAIEDFPWPDPTDEALFAGLEKEARSYYDDGYAVILENLCAGVFEMCCRVRGTEQFLMDLVLDTDVACALMDRFVDLKIRYYEAAARRMGQYVHFVREVDDMAGQESMLISPQIYRDLIKPRHKMLFDAQRRCFPEPFFVFFHSDGAIFDIIPDMIELGLDVLNPAQTTAAGMDAAGLKRKYGRDICFWGGGVDTQHVLPCADSARVRENVREMVEVFAPGGGYIFGAVHNIQDDVPAENIIAMLEEFGQLRDYN
jgi:uroporphyrinogen decarboxylase